MKKLGKLLTTLAVVGGAAAGAYAIYKKYFAADADLEDIDEDFEDEFDEDFDDSVESTREYVSLTPVAEEPAAKPVAEEAPAGESAAEETVSEGIEAESPVDPVDHAPADSAETPVEYSAEAIADKQVALAEAETAEAKEVTE